MSASQRAARIGKLQTALKKNYKLQPAGAARPLLEHVLYASLLEDAPSELADEGMAKCEQEFFDWNEVRVTSVTELTQVLARLPDPAKAANRMKANLQAIFEEFYTFDLDHLKKENLGRAVAKFEKMPGMTSFVLSYTIQHGLGGHSIPIDYSAMVIMLTTEIASQPEANAGKVPGLERAVPKNKGMEFADLLHQCAVALNKSPKDKTARAVLDAVDKGSSKRLDEWLVNRKAAKKRVVKRKEQERAEAIEAAREAEIEAAEIARKKAEKKAAKANPKVVVKKSAVKVEPVKEAPSKAKTTKKPAAKPAAKETPAKEPAVKKTKATSKTKSSPSNPAVKKKTASKKSASKAASPKSSAKSSTTKKASKSSSSKKTPAASAPKKKAKKKAASSSTRKKAPAKKADNRKLTKRKPR